MPKARNATVHARKCGVSFHTEGRLVILRFETDYGPPLVIQITEAAMADVTGHFLRERLFGLH